MDTRTKLPPRPAFAPGRPCPRCGARHGTWYKVAGCRWPRNLWIMGNPPPGGPAFATVSECQRARPWLRSSYTTVMLHRSREDAVAALASIDHHGCGGVCYRDHRLEVLTP